jgi:hypothetical protein
MQIPVWQANSNHHGERIRREQLEAEEPIRKAKLHQELASEGSRTIISEAKGEYLFGSVFFFFSTARFSFVFCSCASHGIPTSHENEI